MAGFPELPTDNADLLSAFDSRIANYQLLVEQNQILTEAKIAEEKQTQELLSQLLTVLSKIENWLEKLDGIPSEIRTLINTTNNLVGQNDTFQRMADKKGHTKPTVTVNIDNEISQQLTFTVESWKDSADEKVLLDKIEEIGYDKPDELDKLEVPKQVMEVIIEILSAVLPPAAIAVKAGKLLSTYFKIRRGRT